jgi:hypothetical protein
MPWKIVLFTNYVNYMCVREREKERGERGNRAMG